MAQQSPCKEVEMKEENMMAENKSNKVQATLSSKQAVDAGEWLVEQNKKLMDENKELKEENRKTSIQLYHWKNNANDANDRLARMNIHKGKPTAAEVFYESSVKRLIEMLTVENQILVEKWNEETKNKKGAEIVKRLEENKSLISSLRLELERKYREIRRLEQILSTKFTEENIRKDMYMLQKRYSSLQKENVELKSYLIQKHNVMEYLKSQFDKLTMDLTKRFKKAYKDDQKMFFKQLEGDEDQLPDFLTKPLINHQWTNTEMKVLCDIKIGPDEDMSRNITVNMDSIIEGLRQIPTSIADDDDRFDSGIGTFNSTGPMKSADFSAAKEKSLELEKQNKSLIEAVLKLKAELKAAQETIMELENEKQTLRTFHNELVDQIDKGSIDYREQLDAKNAECQNMSNELASWRTALTQATDEAQQFKQERDELEDKLKTVETINMNLQQQVPFHVDTVKIIQELENCRKENEHFKQIIQNQHDQLRRNKIQHKELRTAHVETQMSQASASNYPQQKHMQLDEYQRNMIVQLGRGPVPPEPHVAMAGPNWMRNSEIVVSDGPVTPPTKEKREAEEFWGSQHSPTETKSRRSRNTDTRNDGPIFKRNQSTPDMRQNVRSPTGSVMDNLYNSLRDNLYTCEHCSARMPSSLYWDHVRSCTNEQYNE